MFHFTMMGAPKKKKNQDLDCLETVAELGLRILSHRDYSRQNKSEINISDVFLSKIKRTVRQAKQDSGFICCFFANSFFFLPSPPPFLTEP